MHGIEIVKAERAVREDVLEGLTIELKAEGK